MFNRTRTFFRRRGERLKDYSKKVVNAEEIERTWSTMGDMLKDLKGQGKPQRHETFENAYLRMHMDEAKLASTHRYFYWRFFIFAIAAALSVGAILYGLTAGRPVMSIAMSGALAVTLSLAFNASFALYRIQHRQLVDAREWLRHPESWIPAPFKAQAPLGRSVAARPSTGSPGSTSGATIHSLPKRNGNDSRPRAR